MLYYRFHLTNIDSHLGILIIFGRELYYPLAEQPGSTKDTWSGRVYSLYTFMLLSIIKILLVATSEDPEQYNETDHRIWFEFVRTVCWIVRVEGIDLWRIRYVYSSYSIV